MHANKREEIKHIEAGNIAAAVGLRVTTTGDTLCDEKHPILLERMQFANPVISQAIEPRTVADQDKMGQALVPSCSVEDPDALPRAHRRRNRPVHHQRHGRAAPGNHRRPRMEARVQGREANVGKALQVAFRETITTIVVEDYRHIKQAGGHGTVRPR